MSSRLAIRLRSLPHDALAELAAQVLLEATPDTRFKAERSIAQHAPPVWAVSSVLQSEDLLPKILELPMGCAALVCKSWRQCWLLVLPSQILADTRAPRICGALWSYMKSKEVVEACCIRLNELVATDWWVVPPSSDSGCASSYHRCTAYTHGRGQCAD